MRKILLLLNAMVLILCFGCARRTHEGPAYVLHTDLMNLKDFLVFNLSHSENLLQTLHDGQNINESAIIEPLVKNELKQLAPYKEVKILNGVFSDSTGRKLVIKISVQSEKNNQSQNERNFDIRIWSLGQNGIDEQGQGDDINSWAFPKG